MNSLNAVPITPVLDFLDVVKSYGAGATEVRAGRAAPSTSPWVSQGDRSSWTYRSPEIGRQPRAACAAKSSLTPEAARSLGLEVIESGWIG